MIKKATQKDLEKLSVLAKKSFFAAHKDAIPPKLINTYIHNNFSLKELSEQIDSNSCEYNVMYHKTTLVGYSKIIFNTDNNAISEKNITKLERLYVDESYFGLSFGKKLMEFNLKLAKENRQNGVWLYVWIKNYRAITFYQKHGFTIVGSYEFPISENETRPNHLMYLSLKH